MEANDFLAKIKANGDKNDWNNLAKVYNDYKVIASKLSTKERGSFSLNVLCLLCRNLDKAPSWRDSIDNKELLTLTIDCIRETRGLNKAEQVKTLACIYHIHRYVVRLNKQIPPELILKLSFMAFEAEPKNLLKEYSKTYWNIIADRLCYIEKLKGKSVHKLLPKLTEDVIKTIEIYDSAQFCANILVFLVKKLHFIYSESHSEQLNGCYKDIFEKLSQKTDLNAIKKLKDKELLDLYAKFSDCFYVVAENSSKNSFKHSAVNSAVRTAITLLGHKPDFFHCLQTFYLNSFCDIFLNRTTYLDAVFKNLTLSCDITVKLGYETTMVTSYPFLAQFLRLFIEYSVNNSIKTNFTVEVQENCLNFMLKLLKELANCEQLLKCENCSVKTGLHDALRLSFLVKHFISASIQQSIDITNLLTIYDSVIHQQYSIMAQLKRQKCANYEKFYRKLQTDTHNTAIALNKNKNYEFSIKLFEIYIKNELSINLNEFEHKNVARAFYNKSICELDYRKHEQALMDAFLSLIFAKEINSDKYMSLVMDIKAKALKNDDDDDADDRSDDLQMTSVVDACRIVVENKLYGDLKPFLKGVQFSSLLKHEFDMYCKLWPSIAPVAGVWRALNSLLNGRQEEWITGK
uniref:SFRICE_027148 n=1 Tax=Spodoptera frugiperda TaxID=7108 RepID=A0A2H1W678_SPOFR